LFRFAGTRWRRARRAKIQTGRLIIVLFARVQT